MENNCFFGTILRTLGFTVCSAGARVSDGVSGTGSGDNFEGWCENTAINNVRRKEY